MQGGNLRSQFCGSGRQGSNLFLRCIQGLFCVCKCLLFLRDQLVQFSLALFFLLGLSDVLLNIRKILFQCCFACFRLGLHGFQCHFAQQVGAFLTEIFLCSGHNTPLGAGLSTGLLGLLLCGFIVSLCPFHIGFRGGRFRNDSKMGMLQRAANGARHTRGQSRCNDAGLLIQKRLVFCIIFLLQLRGLRLGSQIVALQFGQDPLFLCQSIHGINQLSDFFFAFGQYLLLALQSFLFGRSRFQSAAFFPQRRQFFIEKRFIFLCGFLLFLRSLSGGFFIREFSEFRSQFVIGGQQQFQ